MGVTVQVGRRVSLWRCRTHKVDRMVAASSRWRMKSPSKGPGVGMERELMTRPHCQKGGGCKVTWRPQGSRWF